MGFASQVVEFFAVRLHHNTVIHTASPRNNRAALSAHLFIEHDLRIMGPKSKLSLPGAAQKSKIIVETCPHHFASSIRLTAVAAYGLPVFVT
jgi:hypothetical protein